MTGSRERALRRILAILIGGALIGTLAAACVLPLFESWSADAEAIDRSSRLLAGYRHVIDKKLVEGHRIEALRKQEAGLAGLIGGATSALALANLQIDVKQIVEARGAKIQSMQPGAVMQSHHLERVEIKLDFSMPGGGFAGLLEDLDQHQPYLMIDPIELHASEGNQRSDILTVRMTVGAYRRPAAS